MLEITFKGEPYLFIGPSLAENGAIATRHQYENGLCSTAHFYPDDGDGIVNSFGKKIGTGKDIVVIGEATNVQVDLPTAIDNLFGGDPDWIWNL